MWIAYIPSEGSGGRLRELYDCIGGPGDNVDVLAHGPKPHSIVPKRFQEALGVYVSLLNGRFFGKS